MKLNASIKPALEEISTKLLSARLRTPRSTQLFPDGYSALALGDDVLEEVLPRRGHAAKASERMERAAAALGKSAVGPILYGGFTGLAWVAEYLRREDEDDGNDGIDDALLGFLTPTPWLPTYDLIGGLVGYGLYALERLPRPRAARLLEAIVGHLAANAEPQRIGISWRTNPEWWPPALRSSVSSGFNLGLAHGVPGILGLLGRIWRTGIARPEVERLLSGGVAWLLSRELPASSLSAFGSSAEGGEDSEPSRSAWCYGDPGIASALFVAARATGERAWEKAALRIAIKAATRDPETCLVLDPGLCHGSAGLAHIYNRFHFEAPDERFEKAAHFWLGRTLAMRTPGKGFGGYLIPPIPQEAAAGKKPEADPGFLTGAVGIGLALAAFVAPKTDGWARWDRVMLLSDVPRPASKADETSEARKTSKKAARATKVATPKRKGVTKTKAATAKGRASAR